MVETFDFSQQTTDGRPNFICFHHHLLFPDANTHVSFDSKTLSRDEYSVTRGGLGRKSAIEEPFFDNSPPQNVSALIGKTAFLTCVVKNLGKAKSVRGQLRACMKTIIRAPHIRVHYRANMSPLFTTKLRFSPSHGRHCLSGFCFAHAIEILRSIIATGRAVPMMSKRP